MLKNTALLSLAILVPFLASCSPSEEEIEKVVIETIKKKPELIVEALQDYQDNMDKHASDAQKQAFAKHKEELLRDGYSLVIGNPVGDVKMVVFKDYRCGYCKQAWDNIKQLLAEDKNVKIILKELPVLGPQSVMAAKYAIASEKQGKYKEFDEALMEHNGSWDEASLMLVAQNIGIDTLKLKEDVKLPEIEQKINKNLELARDIGIGGTPAFFIGVQFFPGSIPLSSMKEVIASERKNMQ